MELFSLFIVFFVAVVCVVAQPAVGKKKFHLKTTEFILIVMLPVSWENGMQMYFKVYNVSDVTKKYN